MEPGLAVGREPQTLAVGPCSQTQSDHRHKPGTQVLGKSTACDSCRRFATYASTLLGTTDLRPWLQPAMASPLKRHPSCAIPNRHNPGFSAVQASREPQALAVGLSAIRGP